MTGTYNSCMGHDTFGTLLHNCRLNAKLTQHELADLTGLSSSTISKLERGTGVPRRYTVDSLASALDVAPAERGRLHACARAERHAPARVSTLDKQRNGMSLVPPTSLVGREHEIEAICALLADPQVRVLTLSGPGGVGKTRLAFRVVEEMCAARPDAIHVVGLAEIQEGADMIATIARALALPDKDSRPVYERLVAHLRERVALMLLDNFEQALSAAPLVADLVSRCPRLRVLITSRARLRIAGEHNFTVLPLAVPSETVVAEGRAAVAAYPAVRLFMERMRAVRSGFNITAHNASTVADICRRLDGLPLAIELAAARGGLLGPSALLERMGQRFDLLTTGPCDAPARQQTLRDALAWSYDLLNANEQIIFRVLSVFHGGGSLHAVSIVCADVGGEQAIMDGISSLVDKSLTHVYEDAGDGTRIGMLETIREYGHLCLATVSEEDAALNRHAGYFEAIAEEAYDAIYRVDADVWLDRLAREHDNLLGALAWLVDRNEIERALRLAGALYRFWLRQGYLELGLHWLTLLLAHPDAAHPPSARARALNGAGVLNGERGDLVTAAARFAEAGDLYRLCGDADGEISVAGNEADIARMRGHYAQAQALLERSVTELRVRSNGELLGRTLGSLANVAWEQGRYGAARNYLEEGLALVRLSGHTYEICSMVIDLGGVAVDEGNYAYARRALDEALVMARAHGYHSLIAIALTEMARLMLLQDDAAQGVSLCTEALHVVRQSGELYYENKIMLILAESLRVQGRFVDARARYGDALTAARRLGTSVLTSRAVHGLATLTARDTPDRAVRLWGAAARMYDGTGSWSVEDDCIESTRAALGAERFAALWNEGVAMGDDEVDVYATTAQESAPWA